MPQSIAGPCDTRLNGWSALPAQEGCHWPVAHRRDLLKVRGQWRYLYRAIDSNGDTVEFWFSERRNLTAAKRFLRKALKRHGRPERIVIDGSQTNREAIVS